MFWTAGFRSAVISPYEQIKLAEPRGFNDQTVRQRLHLAGGGERIRVHLTNRYGQTPLTIGGATVDAVALTFDGAGTVVVPPGGDVVSDPLDLPVKAGDDLDLGLYLPTETGLATFSQMPMETADVSGEDPVNARFYVTGVDVLAPDGTPIVVAFGDSWFEGVGSTVGANNRSVDFINRRLDRGWVVNQGISGNRLLRDEVGEHGLARFDRDVLSIPGVTHVLVHFGINDLGLPGMVGEPPATAADLKAGFTELARRARAAGVEILVATIGPFAGAIYPGISTEAGLATRREVNDWIRATFGTGFDVARAVEDPDAPDHIRPAFDSGDGMHLNDEGAKAMAAAVRLPETLRFNETG